MTDAVAEKAAAGSLFDPENYGAGGFLDNVDCTIIDAICSTWSEAPDSCFAIVTFQKDDAEEGEEPRTEYYRIGSLERFTPSKDKTRPVYEEGTKMLGSVKWALLVKSLINAGFPKSKITDDVGFIKGLHVHVNAMPMDIKGDSSEWAKAKGKAGEKKKNAPSVVLVTKIYDEPAKKAAGGAAPKAAPKATPAPTAAAGSGATAAAVETPAGTAAAPSEAEGEAVGVLLEVLSEKGSVNKRLLPNLMFSKIKDVETRKQAVKLVGQNDWLGSPDRPWTFNAGTGDLTQLS